MSNDYRVYFSHEQRWKYIVLAPRTRIARIHRRVREVRTQLTFAVNRIRIFYPTQAHEGRLMSVVDRTMRTNGG